MKKRLLTLILVLFFILPFTQISYADDEVFTDDFSIEEEIILFDLEPEVDDTPFTYISVNLNEAPLNVNVKPDVIIVDGSKYPLFEITWDNPSSIIAFENSLPANRKYDLYVALDYRLMSDGRWASEFWEEISDYSGTHTLPSKKKLIFDTTFIVEAEGKESGEKYKADNFEIRLCYFFMDHNPSYVHSPFSKVLSEKSLEGSTSWDYEGASSWAMNDLNKAAELGFITEKIKKKMDAPITREEFAEIAVIFYEKITGSKAIVAPTSTFADTLNPEILKAFQLKITYGAGKDTTGKDLFKPNNLLDREQMAAMITNSLKAVYPNINLSSSNVPGFADEKEISSWALESAKFMKKYKITEGIGNNNYGPKQNCTREQAVIFLTKAYEKKSEYSLD